MRYWMTTHWPRFVDEPIDEPPKGVWVNENNRAVIARVAPGDLVFIYESKSGRSVVRTPLDGTKQTVRRRTGREGVVAPAKVTEAASEPPDSQPEQYADGGSIWWRYYAKTESVDSGGFVPRPEAAKFLGLNPAYNFHGYGERHSGLREIAKDAFVRLHAAYIESAESKEQERILRATHGRLGGSGEGPEHLALKNRVSADPAAVLGESGLSLVREEWPFAVTGDRIDVLLKDQLRRFVAVEIEGDCDATELAGPLQCMKYRAMLSYLTDRPLEEVRCFLVAHSIHREVETACAKYRIETRVVQRG